MKNNPKTMRFEEIVAPINKQRFEEAMQLAKELEERDFESTENKYDVYQKSTTRYEFITKLVFKGLL